MTQKNDTYTRELHPLCTLFPRMDGEAFATLVADIRANGLRESITLHDGMILDGGNRYRACVEAGVEPRFAEFRGDSVLTFVLSANLHRRHMTPGQQAAIVARAQDWANANTHGGSRKTGQGATLHLDSVTSRAEASGASIRTQKMADAVARKAPELAASVARGETTLPKAMKIIDKASEKPPRAQTKKCAKETDAPTVESLTAENAALRDELHECQDVARALAIELEAFQSVSAGEAEAAKALAQVKGQLAVVESQRDDYMMTCTQLKRQIKVLQRKLKEVA